MITNIIATITVAVVTNTFSTDNHKGCSAWQGIADNGWALYHPFHEGCGPYKPPTEKTDTITVSRVTSLTFHWNGKVRTENDSEELSRHVVTYHTEPEKWVAVSTNAVPPPESAMSMTNYVQGFMTNGFFVGTNIIANDAHDAYLLTKPTK